MRRLFGLLLWLLAGAALAQPAEPRFSAVADRTRLFVGENLELRLSLEGPNVSYSAPFEIPNLEPALRLLDQSGPQTQQSVQIINGSFRRSGSVTMVYVFEARKEGTVTIPALTYMVDSIRLRTEAIKIEILKTEAPTLQAGGTGWQPPSDPYLEAKVDKTEVYVGEQILVSWYFYFIKPFANPRLAQVPAAGDFMAADLGTVNDLNPEPKEFGGETWQVAYLKSMALFPIKAGEAVIEPMVMAVQVKARARDFFGDLFMEDRQVKSDPITITVKPLPEEGKPPGFTGAVGRFTARLDSGALPTLEANTPYKFTLLVEGAGSPDFITKPEIKLPEGFDLYTEATDKKVRSEAGHAVGTRTFKMILVPRIPGEYDLPPFSFPYFDPESKTYQVAQTQPVHFKVLPGRGGNAYTPGTAAGATVTPISQDLRYLKPDRHELPDQGRWLLASPLWFGLQFVPLIGIGAAWGFRRRRERLNQDLAYARKLGAGKRVKQSLKEAAAAMKSGDVAGVCLHTSRAVLNYLSDQFTLAEQGLTTADAVAALRAAGVAEDLVAETEALLAECDRARFASALLKPEDAGKIFAQGRDLIGRLAREGRK